MTVIVKKIGGSLAVVIPRAIAAESKLGEGTSLDVTSTPTGILFQHSGRRPRRSLSKLARQIIPASYARRTAEIMRDPPVGNELI